MNVSDEILEAVKILLSKFKSSLRYDQTYSGSIISVNSDGTYNVEFNGRTQTLKSNNAKVFKIRDSVWVLCPLGDKNSAFIL